eukprot:tig00020903_g15090.t1
MASKPVPFNPRVFRLYRDSLRQLLNWTVDRELFFEEAAKVRSMFEKNRHLRGAAIEQALRMGEEKLDTKRHPDPYIYPLSPGGSSFMRYPLYHEDVLHPEHH